MSRDRYEPTVSGVLLPSIAGQVRNERLVAQRSFSEFSHASNRASCSRLIRLVRLVEQEVGRQLLVLVAGEVGLDDHVSLETETA